MSVREGGNSLDGVISYERKNLGLNKEHDVRKFMYTYLIMKILMTSINNELNVVFSELRDFIF